MIQLIEGKYYKRRDGVVTGPVTHHPYNKLSGRFKAPDPFDDSSPITYYPNGSWFGAREDEWDLLIEVTNPAEVTTDQNALRFDDGKVDFTLIPVDAQEAEARVWAMGELKYGRDNWTKLWGLETRVKVMKSIMRHCYAILKGEDLDPESGLPHAAHIRCNCAMLIKDYENRKGDK